MSRKAKVRSAGHSTSRMRVLSLIGSICLFGLVSCGGGDSGVSVLQTDIDPSYGTQGQVQFSLGVQTASIGPSILQPDGKLIAAGWRQMGSLPVDNYGGRPPSQIFLRRLNGDGTADITFGTEGEVRLNVKGSDTLSAITLQPDGKILLAVNSSEPCVVAVPSLFAACITSSGDPAVLISGIVRLTAQGALDPTFGVSGIVETDASTAGPALAVQADGKILFLRSDSVSRARIFSWKLMRFNADGTRDLTFNMGESVSSRCASDGLAIVVQADGRIVVGGTEGIWYADPTANPGFCMERINADGSHDSDFRSTELWTQFSANIIVNSFSALPNGDLLMLGRACNDTQCGVVASRYDADGVLDVSFGAGGIEKIFIDYTFRVSGSVFTQNGDLLVLGSQTPSVIEGQPALFQPVWVLLDGNWQMAKGFGTNGIIYGIPDNKLPQNILRDLESRWLVISSTTMPDGNYGGVVTRLIGEHHATNKKL